MSHYVAGNTAAEAWTHATEALLVAPSHELVNLSVAVRDPTREVQGITEAVDRFLAAEDARHPDERIHSVATVANTIFPNALYRPGRPDAESRFYLAASRVLARRRRVAPHERSYFRRLVAYSAENPPLNQLERLVRRLRDAKGRGDRNGSLYELTFFDAKRDARPQGFPCLVHTSFSLVDGVLHMTALYRNHYFLRRAYGNYIGLGNLLRFVAVEAGFSVGELLCVSSHAKLDMRISEVRRLHAECAGELARAEAA